ncbi:nucleotidyltransferase domain-containing protein [Candidatus Thiodictyon syntrophicum]|jgi:predicted nucleotidyltransferase|uniref:Polymerase nucleotidyl transferase domain-containing protein n=1 Tax=Candidatus Thiodictyon syntrophicum TaxID=1166950 RepID=A0A2K8UG00_9GAMM|nr:nucleotidyltransferase domain-containing protein [Candidatus Thiodictyon syntrophicum]AUB84457.1 hypothetical protein THSYN_28305 [Candidatus Thiodictyon syntrophicum]
MSTPHAAAAPLPLPAEPEFNEAEVLRQMVDIIVREADPEAIILFGSRARGEAGVGSDVDLLIIEREPFGLGRSRIGEAARLYQALGDMPVSKDLLLYTRAEAERWRGSLNHVVARALREGRVLYGTD